MIEPKLIHSGVSHKLGLALVPRPTTLKEAHFALAETNVNSLEGEFSNR